MKENKKNWKEINLKYKIVPLRFNSKEETELNILYKLSKEKFMSSFIKKCIRFGGSNYKKEENNYLILIESNKEIIKQIKKIGNNLNQIAIKLHLNNSFNKEEKQIVFNQIEDLKKIIFTKLLKK